MQLDSTKPVEYRIILGKPGYRFGDDGTPWTRKRKMGMKWATGKRWFLMKPFVNKRGYHIVTISTGHDRRNYGVHQLVLIAFRGPCPPGMEACHNDGNPRNNCLDNLRWDTPKNNHADKLKHGTQAKGEKQHLAKLTASNAADIRDRFSKGGVSQQSIADEYGMSQTAISQLIRRITWKHI